MSVSLRADFLQEQEWGQDLACARRRNAVEAEQTKIYNFLDAILKLNVYGLSPTLRQQAREGLVNLIEGYLGYNL